MQVVILSGGEGIHLPGSGETIAKGMVNINDQPVICHIMDQFSSFGFNDFIVCAGKHQVNIKKFFLDYYVRSNDVLVDLESNSAIVETTVRKQWRVRVANTGVTTATGGRIKAISKYLDPSEPFIIAYADILADVNIKDLVAQHQASQKKATITIYNASQKFGIVELGDDGSVAHFRNRNAKGSSLINIGFIVMEPSVLDLISGPNTVLEKYPLEELARQGQLGSFLHRGFYAKLDTLSDKIMLDDLIGSGFVKFGN